MNKALYCGIDLHSSNAVYFISDGQDKGLFKKRLPNKLYVVLDALEPFRKRLKIVAVESTYNWYWLVDGLMDHGYPVRLVHPTAIEQYNGLKLANDFTDAAFLAHLGRQGILPTGYIYPKQERPVRDLLRAPNAFSEISNQHEAEPAKHGDAADGRAFQLSPDLSAQRRRSPPAAGGP